LKPFKNKRITFKLTIMNLVWLAILCLFLKQVNSTKAPHCPLNIPSPPTKSSPVLDKLSNDIELLLDTDVSPCDDFYNYACGGKPIDPNVEAAENIKRDVERVLKVEEKSSDASS
jgi:hypothetical protein